MPIVLASSADGGYRWQADDRGSFCRTPQSNGRNTPLAGQRARVHGLRMRLPFRDGIDNAAANGINAVIQPGGFRCAMQKSLPAARRSGMASGNLPACVPFQTLIGQQGGSRAAL